MKLPTGAQAILPVLFLTHAFAQQPPAAPLSRLQAGIERITKSINADWGIYIKCLETGEEIAIDADHQMDTMSVIKIPLMVEAFRQIEAGKFSLDQPGGFLRSREALTLDGGLRPLVPRGHVERRRSLVSLAPQQVG